MIPAKGSIGRHIDRPDADVRFYLFFGPDESQSRIFAGRLLKSLGAEKSAISAAALKADPALLADEASAISLFGGKRLLWIEPAGEDMLIALQAFLESPAPESRAVAIAGDLKKSSGLRRLAESDPRVVAHISYMPEGDAIERIIEQMAGAEGLKAGPAVAQRIAAACGNDRAVIAQELEKFAAYVDASPEQPRELGPRTLDELAAGGTESGFNTLADLALSGDLAGLANELELAGTDGGDSVTIVRSLQRRLLTIAPIRARVDAGENAGAVMASLGKALFWKDKEVVGRIVGAWDSAGLARISTRLGKLERDLMLTGVPRAQAVGEELSAIARAARRR
jgi:DNA polymerase-3 subunit delta